jgi:Zn-dependent protease
MRMSWKLGRVAGIDVYLHPSFLFLFLFPGVLDRGPLGVGLILAAFGCVLLHEFGHALMARRYGIETEDITLYPIGGVARLQRLPRSPGAELLIALAGPAVNVALVMVLLGLMVLDLAPPDTLAGVFAVNLLFVNAVLAGFNLIPAFPMDGGRVLRALLSGWVGRVRATSIAAGLGRVLALLFGLYSLFYGSWIQVALAAFIYMAAGGELAQVLAEEGRRRASRFSGPNEGIWTAPPGFHWVHRGNGVWQLAPVVIAAHDGPPPQWH